MNAKQTQTLEQITAGAATVGLHVKALYTDGWFKIYYGPDRSKKILVFRISEASGKPVDARFDCVYGLKYLARDARKEVADLMDYGLPVEAQEEEADEKQDFSDVEQHLDQNQPEPKIEYQVWWHLNLELMDENIRSEFLDSGGNVPQFLAVSHLYTYGDAQDVMNDYQRRFPGNFYYVKELAA